MKIVKNLPKSERVSFFKKVLRSKERKLLSILSQIDKKKDELSKLTADYNNLREDLLKDLNSLDLKSVSTKKIRVTSVNQKDSQRTNYRRYVLDQKIQVPDKYKTFVSGTQYLKVTILNKEKRE